MRCRVDKDDGVRRHFRLVRFNEKLDRVVEVVCRFLDQYRLGRRLRMRLSVEQFLGGGRLEYDGCAEIWRR